MSKKCLELILIIGLDQGQVAEILIRAGADVNAKAQDDWTPLHYTAKNSKYYHPLFRMRKENTTFLWFILFGFIMYIHVIRILHSRCNQ